MPEEPTPSPESTPPASEAKWTDDIDPSLSENAPVPAESETIAEEWEENLDWEDDPVESPSPPASTPSTREALAWLQPLWRRSIASWRRILAGMRSRIPATAKLSDGVLSGILIGGLVLLVAVLSNVWQSSVAPDIAETTPPNLPSTIEANPPADRSTDQPGSPDTDLAERDRIAEMQNQLMDGSFSEENGLIESLQADFKHNYLTVSLSDGWYRLSVYEQEKLANHLRQQSSQMNFDDLQLRSPDGDLLARSPVIGDKMVVLQHKKPPEVELPPSRPRYRLTIDR